MLDACCSRTDRDLGFRTTMCGILITVRTSSSNDQNVHSSPETFENLWDRLKDANAARGDWDCTVVTNSSKLSRYLLWPGPDASRTVVKSLDNTLQVDLNQFAVEVRLFASELRLRGTAPVEQPHFGGFGGRDTGNVLCWNGEVYALSCLNGLIVLILVILLIDRCSKAWMYVSQTLLRLHVIQIGCPL